MALEATFHNLHVALGTLHEALTALRTTVREDKPLEGDVVLVDVFGDAADDFLGLVDEALASAADADIAVAAPTDLHRLRFVLTTCQTCFKHITQPFATDLVHYERIAELMRFGRVRGGEWHAWAMSVKAALDWCRQPLFDVDEALFNCWQELTERSCLTMTSAQATSVGYHLTLPSRGSIREEIS